VRSPRDQPGINVGILLAAIGAGALIGLLGTSVLRRRRE
jgi:LPXTG-motif cell wall-anchored protein